MTSKGTLLLTRSDVAELLGIEECTEAVERAFRLHGEGKTQAPGILGVHARDGGFHIKAGIMDLGRSYFVAKTNANFPGNHKIGLPTIQGVIVVCDAVNGELLALMDSIEITIIRTGAATAVATKYLARQGATVATICGCGNQGRISLKALMKVRNLEKVFVLDTDKVQADKLAREFSQQLQVIPISVNELKASLKESQVVVTCTPSKKPFLRAKDIMPGTFIADIGADSEEKQE